MVAHHLEGSGLDGDVFKNTLADLRLLLSKEEDSLAKAERRVAAVRSAIEALAHVHVDNPKLSAGAGNAKATKPEARRRPRQGSLANLIRMKVSEILRENGKPMTRSEIHEKLISKGVTLEMNQPLKRVSKILWDAREFESTANGYWFSAVADLRAGDEPTTET